MFTLKFMTIFDNGTSTQTSISCPNYSVYKYSNRYSITAYPGFTDTGGVERHVCETEQKTDSHVIPQGAYQSCYVENEKGKTIDVFSARDFTEKSSGSVGL